MTWARLLQLWVGLAAMLVISGCSSGPEGRPAWGVREAALLFSVANDEATPDRLTITVPGGEAIDSDGNGAADLIPINLLLFQTSGPSGAPLWKRGTARFVLTTLDGEALRAWDFDEQALHDARARIAFGKAYQFGLSLLDNGGSDRVPSTWVRVECQFALQEGPLLRSGSTAVQVGG